MPWRRTVHLLRPKVIVTMSDKVFTLLSGTPFAGSLSEERDTNGNNLSTAYIEPPQSDID
jgi:hypothetical protein